MHHCCTVVCFKKYDPRFGHLSLIRILEACETRECVLLLPRMRSERGLGTLLSSREFTSVVKESSPTCCSDSFCWRATGILSLEVSPWVGVSLILSSIGKMIPPRKMWREKSQLEMCHCIEHGQRKSSEMVSYNHKASPSLRCLFWLSIIVSLKTKDENCFLFNFPFIY